MSAKSIIPYALRDRIRRKLNKRAERKEKAAQKVRRRAKALAKQEEKQRRRDTPPHVPTWTRAEQAGEKKVVRVGVAGAGRYAPHHLEVLAAYEQVEIVSLLTSGAPRGARVAEQYGIGRHYTDLDAFSSDPDVDCFVIVVPPAAMVEVATACLASGRAALLEKPPGVTSADAESLARTAEEAGTWGMVGVNRRFYSVIEHGLAALAEFGPIHGAILEVPQRITEFRGEGRLSDFDLEHFYVRNSIHDVDLLRYVLGDPVAVHSRAWPNVEHGNASASFAAVFDYGNGVQATLLDLWDTPDQMRLKVVAELGWVEWELPRHGLVCEREKRAPIPIDRVDFDFRAGLWSQDLHFVEAVRAGREAGLPASTLRDAGGTMRMMEQIQAGSLGR